MFDCESQGETPIGLEQNFKITLIDAIENTSGTAVLF